MPKFFDDARRSKVGDFANYGSGANLCNTARDVVSKKGKEFEILVHWITYIADRGSDFRRIWDVGGYVYSQYLADWVNENADLKNIFGLNAKDKYLCDFGQKNNDGKDVKNYRWIAKNDENNKRLEKYKFEKEDFVDYVSRYCVADYVNTLFALSVLQDYDKSLLSFLSAVCKKIPKDDVKKQVRSIAMALYLLTYDDLRADFAGTKMLASNKNSDEEKESVSKKLEDWRKELFDDGFLEKRKEKLLTLLSNEEFEETYKKFFEKKHQFVNMKRVWCALRDYIKDVNYNNVFFKKVFGVDISDKDEKFIDLYAQHLELPGDVWNNNSSFLKCVFIDEYMDDEIKQEYQKYFGKNKYEAKKLLRVVCDKYSFGEQGLYPEIFDCTFNFAPRMCDSNGEMCSICPYSKDAYDFDKLCVKQKQKLCPVVLVCCGYKKECDGDDCVLVDILNK